MREFGANSWSETGKEVPLGLPCSAEAGGGPSVSHWCETMGCKTCVAGTGGAEVFMVFPYPSVCEGLCVYNLLAHARLD